MVQKTPPQTITPPTANYQPSINHEPKTNMPAINQPATHRMIMNAQQVFITEALSLIRAFTENQAVHWFSGSFLFLFGQAKRKEKPFAVMLSTSNLSLNMS
jgi:hypothetical protein